MALAQFFMEMTGIGAVQQAGALPHQVRDGTLKVLLVQSKTTKRWIFPKGNIEPELTPHESAFFEAFEEAGVFGVIKPRSIGSYTYCKSPEKGGDLCRVRLYPLAVKQELPFYPEKKVRAREWMTVEQAVAAINNEKLKSILVAFAKRA